MNLNEIAKKHYAWLTKMGWGGEYAHTSPLEQLALLTSEIGEAVNECRGNQPTERLGVELADIILRTVGLAERLGIDIEEQVHKKMAVNEVRGNLGRIK